MIDRELDEGIRDVLNEFAGLATDARKLHGNSDLYAAGMTSFASVSVMLGLEERFAITFPESVLQRTTFESIRAITNTIAQLRAESSADPAS